MITVLAPGPLSTIQDRGRPGLAHLGIGASGAADRDSHDLANALVGNRDDAATIEMTLGRLRVRFETAAAIAVTGAGCPLKLDGSLVPAGELVRVLAGQELRVGAPSSGLRSYLAVAGGIDVPTVLGSRSTDTLSGLGPAKLSPGQVLALGPLPPAQRPTRPTPRLDDDRPLTVIPGPRNDWFDPAALETLCRATWTVTPDTNRVGARLTGPALERSINRELPSEAMVAGALQVPPNGQPILFLADHPVTGGYPVIAVVTEADVSRAAQLRPGATVAFALHPTVRR